MNTGKHWVHLAAKDIFTKRYLLQDQRGAKRGTLTIAEQSLIDVNVAQYLLNV